MTSSLVRSPPPYEYCAPFSWPSHTHPQDTSLAKKSGVEKGHNYEPSGQNVPRNVRRRLGLALFYLKRKYSENQVIGGGPKRAEDLCPGEIVLFVPQETPPLIKG